MNALSLVLLMIALVPFSYLVLLAVAARRDAQQVELSPHPVTRFLVSIPAHDEDNVIEATVLGLLSQNYPSHLFDVHVVADHCTDKTAEVAASAGAFAHERNDGPRTGKGAALSWLFEKILPNHNYDAVVVFDADTKVHQDFLRLIDARLCQGAQAVQGQHVIRNPEMGWFPALIWAMFLVDNRYQNLGRDNLGWSAKNMGDSVCFRADLIKRMGWGSGLTDDYQLRQRMLLEGVRLHYEPTARGFGEAPLTWTQANSQRARWLRGTHTASRDYARRLLRQGLLQRDPVMLDGAIQAYFPSYSTLTMLCCAWLAIQFGVNLLLQPVFGAAVIWLWFVMVVMLFVYPWYGLYLEKAPRYAYWVMLSGPFYIVWRTWLAFSSRFLRRNLTWKRTSHGLSRSR